MRIDGQWYECEDRTVRPIILGDVLDANGEWRQVSFWSIPAPIALSFVQLI